MPNTTNLNAILISSTQYLNVIFGLCAWAAISLLFSCSEPLPAETQLLNNLNNTKLAVETLDTNKLKGFLAPEFNIKSPEGSYDLARIKRTMLGLSLRKQRINIILSQNKVTLSQHNTQLASIHSSVLATGGKGLIPEDGKLYQLETQWRLYGDDWKITGVSWK